jgi:hypothetical protein
MANAIYCRNGHYVGLLNPGHGERVSTARIRAMAAHPENFERKLPAFCQQCGAKNIVACEDCQTPIDHRYPSDIHKYCVGCGKPFPWTVTALASAREYTDELEGLSGEDKTVLKGTFIDLTFDSPKTEIAASRFKTILRKLTPDVAETIRKTIVEIASETAVKLIKG